MPSVVVNFFKNSLVDLLAGDYPSSCCRKEIKGTMYRTSLYEQGSGLRSPENLNFSLDRVTSQNILPPQYPLYALEIFVRDLKKILI